jgi:hypothetical protein
MVPCDRTGHFRCDVLDYGLKEMESGAVSVALHVLLTEMWDGENWQPWREYGMEAFGDIWIIKKDGVLNDRQAKALMQYAGWDASLTSLSEATWKPTACQVEIGHQKYKDEDQYKINWLNDFNRTPGAGALSNVDGDKVKSLEARFGSPLRALQGNVKRNAAPANGSKPTPPPKSPAMAGAASDDGIPFALIGWLSALLATSQMIV